MHTLHTPEALEEIELAPKKKPDDSLQGQAVTTTARTDTADEQSFFDELGDHPESLLKMMVFLSAAVAGYTAGRIAFDNISAEIDYARKVIEVCGWALFTTFLCYRALMWSSTSDDTYLGFSQPNGISQSWNKITNFFKDTPKDTPKSETSAPLAQEVAPSF